MDDPAPMGIQKASRVREGRRDGRTVIKHSTMALVCAGEKRCSTAGSSCRMSRRRSDSSAEKCDGIGA